MEQDTIILDNVASLPDNYKPLVFPLNVSDKTNYIAKPILSSGTPYPCFSFGFQQYLHANRDKMPAIKKSFENKKKVYQIVNDFETTIDGFDADLDHVSVEYFNIKDGIKHRDFYSFWEMVITFDLININKSLSAMYIDDTTGGVEQALKLYRSSFAKSIKSDKYITTSTTKASINLAISMGKLQWHNELTQEQEFLNTLLTTTCNCLQSLDKDGNYICRIYETFTQPMYKLIYILTSLFKSAYIYKPLLSHLSSSEKYFIGIGFNPRQKQLDELSKTVELITKSHQNIIDWFDELMPSDDFKNTITKANTKLANKQIININKIATYVDSQNYFGEVYQKNKLAQVQSSKYWINMYYPNKGEYTKSIKRLNNLITKV